MPVSMADAQCMWCSRGYPPALPSREHVLPDYLGVSARLPEGVVCKECNNRLNHEVDRPLKAVFQPLLTTLGIRSGKRPTVASTPVTVQTSLGAVQATLGANSALRFHPQRQHREQDAEHVCEQWVCSPEDADQLRQAFEAKYGDTHDLVVETGPVDLGGMTAALRAKGGVLKRAAVKAGLNCLAWKSPALLRGDRFAAAVRYVLDGTGDTPDLLGTRSQALTERIEPEWCRPEHRILVQATSGGECWMELRIFGDIFCRVRTDERWEGPDLALDETFTVERFVTRGK